jgi:DNA-directed RNA polymerase subunit M/transcription elongation factor TFIIS
MIFKSILKIIFILLFKQMTREICIYKFNDLLNDLNLSEKIEESIYNYTTYQSELKGIEKNIKNKYFKRIYVNKTITLYNNLDKDSYIKNTLFIEKIKYSDFDIRNIAFLTPQEIHSEHWKKYMDRQCANDEFLYSRTSGIHTNEYKCNRCKEKNCTYYLLQVRCSDEPMTTFINCLNCGNKWSFN